MDPGPAEDTAPYVTACEACGSRAPPRSSPRPGAAPCIRHPRAAGAALRRGVGPSRPAARPRAGQLLLLLLLGDGGYLRALGGDATGAAPPLLWRTTAGAPAFLKTTLHVFNVNI